MDRQQLQDEIYSVIIMLNDERALRQDYGVSNVYQAELLPLLGSQLYRTFCEVAAVFPEDKDDGR